MKAAEARVLGDQIAAALAAGDIGTALQNLDVVLRTKTPFRTLDLIAAQLASVGLDALSSFYPSIAEQQTIGGWVIIASSLNPHLDQYPDRVIELAQDYIIRGDVWHACDSIGERVLGPAMVADFSANLRRLESWRRHPNRWVRRALGVGGHVWAKRARGSPEKRNEGAALLAFYQPLFAEENIDAVKGIGWALKTIGRHYADLLIPWLEQQLSSNSPHATMRRKAFTYLPKRDQQRLKKLVAP